LCAAAAAVAGLLLLQHHGEPRAVATVSEACGDARTSGCEEVARSHWSRVAGFPVAAWGLAFYASTALLLFLALVGPTGLAWPLALVAAGALVSALLVDVVLLALQAFSIRAFCVLCLLTYLLGVLALAALWPARRAAAVAGAAFAGPEGRLALAGWATGSLAILAFVFAANLTLVHRAAHRQARLLGAPAGPVAAPAAEEAPPGATAPAAGPAESAATPAAATAPQDASYWREQAQKLQATIDDPAKLEAYFAARAQREFETAKVESIDLANTPVKGPASAPVTVVEYSDFMCPVCRNLAAALSQFVPRRADVSRCTSRTTLSTTRATRSCRGRPTPAPARSRSGPSAPTTRASSRPITTVFSAASSGTRSRPTSCASRAKRGSTPRRWKAASPTPRRRRC
jgi:uncharacterized membrane protein